MSSLAGALEPLASAQETNYVEEDVEMDPITPAEASENEEQQDEDQEMHDLFGEGEEVVRNEDATTPASEAPAEAEPTDGLSSPERRHREAMEYPEEDNESVVQQVLEANATIPNIPVPRSSDGNYWVIRMPNFVKMDSKPFHPDSYIGPEDEEVQAESVREKSMTIKLKVENTVRWRWVKDENGNDRRQSNARVVRWSDGSVSLQLGKELFDITRTIDTSGAVHRQAFGGSQSQASQVVPSSSQPASERAQGLTYLVAQHKRAEILQCEALITGYMSLRPTGMQSETHRMLVRAVGQKHNRVARLRMAPDPTTDPEREKMEMMRQAARKPRRARGEDDGFGAAKKRRSYTRRRTGEDMWSEDEDEEGYGMGGSEDEYGGEGAGAGSGKRKRSGEKEKENRKGPGEYQTDDFVVADSDEEGGGGDSDDGAARRRRRKSRVDDNGNGEEDDLEKLDAQIDRQEAEERKRRKDKGDDDDEDAEQAMDVESEEDEDDGFGARRRTHGSRKRRAIGLDDEEEEEE